MRRDDSGSNQEESGENTHNFSLFMRLLLVLKSTTPSSPTDVVVLTYKHVTGTFAHPPRKYEYLIYTVYK